MRRPQQTSSRTAAAPKRYNRLIARRRAVETTAFATWKRRMELTCIRYIGLAMTGQIVMAAIAFNMRRWAAIPG